MTTVYAESSAVLAWLLGEPVQDAIIDLLSDADQVVTSALTALECARGLRRARLDDRISEAEAAAALRVLDTTLDTWQVLDLTENVLTASRGYFPHEPVRMLDAVHLATALIFEHALGQLDMLSLDERVRRNAVDLGMTVVPAR